VAALSKNKFPGRSAHPSAERPGIYNFGSRKQSADVQAQNILMGKAINQPTASKNGQRQMIKTGQSQRRGNTYSSNVVT